MNMDAQIDHLRQLTAKLKENLELCAKSPTVDAVHDVRTGTRRVEAMLDTILRVAGPAPRRRSPIGANASDAQPPAESPAETVANPLQEAAERWLRLLKRIRRAAAPVRDLDVHRKLLEKLAGGGHKDAKQETESAEALQEAASTDSTEGLEAANAPLSPEEQLAAQIELQADDLDAWLRHTREDNARALVKSAHKWADKLDGHLVSIEEAMRARRQRRLPGDAAVHALEAFARLAAHMQQLHAGNLHDFRKGAKKARYMAEAGGDDEYAGAVGKALKKLQDEIGDWHDWLVLAEEAQKALGDHGLELTARIEAQRDEHFASAMKTTERMRGRLMGEWEASRSRRRTRLRKHAQNAS